LDLFSSSKISGGRMIGVNYRNTGKHMFNSTKKIGKKSFGYFKETMQRERNNLLGRKAYIVTDG